MAKGKEHPTRWTEKLGQTTVARPAGKLIWLHAVGLGEVLSLRGLIDMMADQTDAHFLVTSSTRAGAEAFARNTPPRTIHQFLPLDAPTYRRAFLGHWAPDLCIWAEQDIWPGFVTDLANRGTPQALIASRMNAQSYAKHAKTRGLFSHIYNQMRLITAQDTSTAKHLADLGATNVTITGSLKPCAPPLTCNMQEYERLNKVLQDRFVWITAPAHQADVDLAIAAHQLILTDVPDALLIIAPRFPDAPLTIPLPHTKRSLNEDPTGTVWLADTFGDLGLMYRLAKAALIGGTNDTTQGHNPWEAVALDTAIFHGPQVANFQTDYAALAANGATCVTSSVQLAKALRTDLAPATTGASKLRMSQLDATQNLATDLLALVPK